MLPVPVPVPVSIFKKCDFAAINNLITYISSGAQLEDLFERLACIYPPSQPNRKPSR
jgi:hypothetical protein